MKQLKKTLLTLVALLAVTTGAYAASVSYIDGNGTSQTVDATELESTTTSWTDGSWYIVPEGGLTISGRIAVSGTVNLILRDGTELTASAGITTTGATLNIYAQSTGTGALTATGANGASHTGGNAGIGGIGVGDRASGGAGGTVNIYGGTVTATGGNGGLGGGGGAGIGGGGLGWTSNAGSGAGGTVNIYGGAVTATGGTGGNYSGGAGAGIGRGANGYNSSAGADGTLTLGVGVKLYNGTDNTGTVLDDNDSESRNYSGSRPKNMFAEGTVVPSASSGPEVAWDKTSKTGSFTMPGGNVTLEPEYYPQAALAAAPTAINDVPATTDGAIVEAGTVANIGETATAQGTVMYYVSPTALDDAALLALAADKWTADVPTAAGLAQGQAYVYYYVRGNDSDNDDEIFSDGDILAANALTVTIAAAPTYAVTFADGVNPEPPAEPEWTASPAADVKKGQTVTVTYTGTKKVIGVKAEKKASAVPVTAITLNKTETSIKVGATETLSVTSVLPEEATDKTYTWKTSDATKATVDQDGKVTAVAEGTVTIYAEANDGSGVKGNCTVTVTPATITVTWNNDDITGSGKSFTKDGVTITAGYIDFGDKNFMMGGTFTTTLGNFTKIEVTTAYCNASGTGWSGSTWTGNASSVLFSGDIVGAGKGNTKLVFTIEPTN